MAETVGMRMAKATEEDLRSVREFFQMLEEITEYGTYTQEINGEEDTQSVRDDATLADLIRDKWPYVACSWSRVVWGCDMLIKNVCDPEKDYLDYNPELKKLIENAQQIHDGTASGQDG